MTLDDKTQKMLGRIKKLFAVAEEGSGATDEERDTAVLKAQELLLKYKLDPSEVHAHTDGSVGIGEKSWPWSGEDWELVLLCSIAKYFMCKAWGTHRSLRHQKVTIAGEATSRESLYFTWRFCCTQMDRELNTRVAELDKRAQYAHLARSRYSDAQAEFQGPPRPQHKDIQAYLETLPGDMQLQLISKLCGISETYASEVRPYIRRGEFAPEIVPNMGIWKRSFLRGMCSGVAGKVERHYSEVLHEASEPGKEMVRREMAAVMSYMERYELTQRKSEAMLDPRAAEAGFAAGQKINVGGTAGVAAAIQKELN